MSCIPNVCLWTVSFRLPICIVFSITPRFLRNAVQCDNQHAIRNPARTCERDTRCCFGEVGRDFGHFHTATRLGRCDEYGVGIIHGLQGGVEKEVIFHAIGQPCELISPDVVSLDKCLDESTNPNLHNRIVHSTVAYTKEFAEKYPYRDGDIAKLGIDDFCQQIEGMVGGAKFDFIPQRLACYRELSSQITKKRDQKAVMADKRKFIASLKVPA